MTASGSPPLVGLQLYTLRGETMPLDALLARVAALGYDGVETVGTQGASPEALRDALGRHGLRFASAHVGLRPLREAPSETLETYARAGTDLVVVPWLEQADRPTSRSGWERLAQELDALGASARAAGLGLAYHHHGFELDATAGTAPLEIILDVADPARLVIELDVGWLMSAGHDPVAWIERTGARCRRIHAKDVGPSGAGAGGPAWADVGDGVVDWAAVVGAAAGAGVPWLLVEHDAPADGWVTAERSVRALRGVITR
jgi:sugar phosphate isomerase/epimerase